MIGAIEQPTLECLVFLAVWIVMAMIETMMLSALTWFDRRRTVLGFVCLREPIRESIDPYNCFLVGLLVGGPHIQVLHQSPAHLLYLWEVD